MDALKDHTIEFVALKDGVHQFHFELGTRFFNAASDELLDDGLVTADVELEKGPAMLVAQIHCHGTVHTTCDHCNGPLDQPVDGRQREVFHLNGRQRFDGMEDDVVGLDPDDHAIELTHYLYECVRLAMPTRRLHAQGQCDPEVEAALARHQHTDGTEQGDPRWAALRTLKQQR
ncbi:MAG: DUF177 domain-containing protein [Flavobacteriales bacterium]|nr:DUF177 domain-containing protein [Flavobacteriales bacterium]MCB9166983.1 DUF177 domain-containing protein [Flavobacteriales bacterium]